MPCRREKLGNDVFQPCDIEKWSVISSREVDLRKVLRSKGVITHCMEGGPITSCGRRLGDRRQLSLWYVLFLYGIIDE